MIRKQQLQKNAEDSWNDFFKDTKNIKIIAKINKGMPYKKVINSLKGGTLFDPQLKQKEFNIKKINLN